MNFNVTTGTSDSNDSTGEDVVELVDVDVVASVITVTLLLLSDVELDGARNAVTAVDAVVDPSPSVLLLLPPPLLL
jgi:hypothetical protein